MLKINFNGALFTEDKKSGIGVIIRNSQGLILASLSQLLPHDYTIAEVEALAAVTALQFARELDILEVVLEGDSEIIITTLTDEHYPLTTYDLILQDANLLFMSFTQLRYSHVRKEGNMVTHNLARYARNVSILLYGWRMLHHMSTM